MTEKSELEALVQRVVSSLDAEGPEGAPSPETTLRERFYELVILAFGNLFPRMPTTGNIYDRNTLQRIILGLDDGEAASLGKKADDWMRLEGMIRQEEGKRSYYLAFNAQAALSVQTSAGLLGDVCQKILKRYAASNPSDECRAATRDLAAAIFQLLKT
jgi:hypothetical protein